MNRDTRATGPTANSGSTFGATRGAISTAVLISSRSLASQAARVPPPDSPTTQTSSPSPAAMSTARSPVSTRSSGPIADRAGLSLSCSPCPGRRGTTTL